jgi:hypothetical protein
MYDAIVDLAGVSTGFEVVPEGDYRVRLTNHSIGPSAANLPAYKLVITIIDPPEYAGKAIPAGGTLQPEKLFGFKRCVAAFGAPDDILEAKGRARIIRYGSIYPVSLRRRQV